MSEHKCKIPNVCLSEKTFEIKYTLEAVQKRKTTLGEMSEKMSEVFTGKGISGQTEVRIMCVFKFSVRS
jgi:hypothetical protein